MRMLHCAVTLGGRGKMVESVTLAAEREAMMIHGHRDFNWHTGTQSFTIGRRSLLRCYYMR